MTIESAGNAPHRVFVVMGVSGSGKSAVAIELGRRMGAAVLDGDFLHPRANILKMAAGQALDDRDRAPWLAAVSDAAFAMQRTQPMSVIVCSALKRRYRDQLRQGNPTLRFIYLRGSRKLIESRLRERRGHFFRPEMLATQFAALEEPEQDETDVLVVEVDPPLEAVVESLIDAITAAG